MNKGIAGSAGYGVGKVVIISDAKPEYENRTITDTDAEIKPRYLKDTYFSSQIRGWMR